MNLLKYPIFQKRWFRIVIIALGLLVVSFFSFYLSIYWGAFGKVPDTESLSNLKQNEATQVLDQKGELIGKYFIYDRQPIEFNDLPKHLIDALIATEDVRFYDHDGVDNISLLRVFFKTILTGDKSSGGGSTITLQLVKNLFGRKNYGAFGIVINKVKESIAAKRLETLYTKEEILTLYFNTVPFPDNTYGIESAAQKFFNTSTEELSLSQAAVLIGSLKANHSYNPRLFPERSQLRRDVVLQQMSKYNFIHENTAKKAMNEPIQLDYQFFNHDQGLAPYFRAQVKRELDTLLVSFNKEDGSAYDYYKDGLVIHTTLDSRMQQIAEDVMKDHLSVLQELHEKAYGRSAPWFQNKKLIEKASAQIPQYKKWKAQGLDNAQIRDSLSVKKDMELFGWKAPIQTKASIYDSLQHYLKMLNTGFVAIDPSNGAVQSYIGGIDYRYFKYDHITQSKRQVGSTFKPFVYTAAIENGMNPCSYFSLKEVTYTDQKNWTPTNASDKEEDPYLNYTLEKALSNSVNTIAVKVLEQTGMTKVIDLVKKLGIKENLPEEPSIALGTAGISVIEMAGAYASYANNSQPVNPFYITKILDKTGKVIYKKEDKTVLPPAYNDYTRQVLLEMMKETIESGTAKRIRSIYGLKQAIAGKTGTTQDNKDGWFVGITPKLVTVTWVGSDSYEIGFKNTNIGQGANSALPIFANFYKKLAQDSTYQSITESQFETTTDKVLQDLECAPVKRDGFFKRLFSKKKKKKKFDQAKR